MSLEKIARMLDDPNMTLAESAAEIAGKMGIDSGTVWNFIHAKRAGFSSYLGSVARRNGFSTPTEYLDNLAHQKGYRSHSAYGAACKMFNLDDHPDLAASIVHDKYGSGVSFGEREGLSEEQLEIVLKARRVIENVLTPVERDAFNEHYVHGKKVEVIAAERGVVHQAVSLAARRALGKIRKRLGVTDSR